MVQDSRTQAHSYGRFCCVSCQKKVDIPFYTPRSFIINCYPLFIHFEATTGATTGSTVMPWHARPARCMQRRGRARHRLRPTTKLVSLSRRQQYADIGRALKEPFVQRSTRSQAHARELFHDNNASIMFCPTNHSPFPTTAKGTTFNCPVSRNIRHDDGNTIHNLKDSKEPGYCTNLKSILPFSTFVFLARDKQPTGYSIPRQTTCSPHVRHAGAKLHINYHTPASCWRSDTLHLLPYNGIVAAVVSKSGAQPASNRTSCTFTAFANKTTSACPEHPKTTKNAEAFIPSPRRYCLPLKKPIYRG